MGVVVAGVEVLQARAGVIALADVALGFRGVECIGCLGLLAERAVGRGLGAQACAAGDGAERAEPVAVQHGLFGRDVARDDLLGAVRRMRTRLRTPYPRLASGTKEAAPLDESSGTVRFEVFSGVERAFLIEVTVDRAM